MSASERGVTRTFTNPLSGVSLGDPYVLRHRGRFYLYGTADGPPPADGRAIPVYRSDDLVTWEPLGGALAPQEPAAEHWAPEVLAWNGRFHMVVSFGDQAGRGHALWAAVAGRPEGPFHLHGRLSAAGERFAIDGSWLLDDDGRLYLYRCADFVEEGDGPHGTGIVVQPMDDPFTPAAPPTIVLRAGAPARAVRHENSASHGVDPTFAGWMTHRAPAPVKRLGRYFCGYTASGPDEAPGIGELVADGPLAAYGYPDGSEGPIFGTIPGLVEGPGHFSVIRPDMVHDWIVLHGRLPGESARRVWLCPATWGPEGVSIGDLTDRPQEAPPLPQHRFRFADAGETLPTGWTFEGEDWKPDPEGILHGGTGKGICRPKGLELAGDWALEVYIRFPAQGPFRAGLALDFEGARCTLSLGEAHSGKMILITFDGEPRVAPLPALGAEAFDYRDFHPVLVRCLAGCVEIRIDGVVAFSRYPLLQGPAHLSLFAEGPALFDAVSITLDSGP